MTLKKYYWNYAFIYSVQETGVKLEGLIRLARNVRRYNKWNFRAPTHRPRIPYIYVLWIGYGHELGVKGSQMSDGHYHGA